MRTTNPTRRGFTMVELLVVIIVIGLLAAMLLPALSNSVRKAKQAAIVMELSQLESAIEAYKTANAGEYPPDFTDLTHLNNHIRRAFPRSREVINTTTWATMSRDEPGRAVLPQMFFRLDPAEAIVFWLSEVHINPQNPLTGEAEHKSYFQFEQKRLRDVDGDGWFEYYPKEGGDAPYVYFHNKTYLSAARSSPSYPSSDRGIGFAKPYLARPASSPVAAEDFANANKFQLLSAGLDGHFGEHSGSLRKVFPSATLNIRSQNCTLEDRDNLANFGDGRNLGDNEP